MRNEFAIQKNPANERARLALARVLSAAGHEADAERALRELLQVLPDSALARVWLGQLYEAANRFADARREFERLQALQRGVPVAQLEAQRQPLGFEHCAYQLDVEALCLAVVILELEWRVVAVAAAIRAMTSGAIGAAMKARNTGGQLINANKAHQREPSLRMYSFS